MAISGAVWKENKNEIIASLKKHEGKVTYAAKELGVHYETLMKRIKVDSELEELLDHLRNSFNKTLLDQAENVLVYAMNCTKKDLGNALKASFYVLNNKGEEIGYSMKNNPNNQQGNGVTRDDLKDFFESTKNTGSISGTCESKQPEMENE